MTIEFYKIHRVVNPIMTSSYHYAVVCNESLSITSTQEKRFSRNSVMYITNFQQNVEDLFLRYYMYVTDSKPHGKVVDTFHF